MTQTWSTPGGAFAATASATTAVDRDGRRFTWSAARMVTDVQGWLSTPTTNHGWILVGDETATRTAKRFDSHENGDVTRRPILTVTYTAPAATGACCAASGSCSLVTDPGTSCTGTYLGPATVCSPNPCTIVTGACCAASGGCSIVAHPGGSCTGTYQGRDTTCAPNPCPQPTGACCDTGGSCSVATSSACAGTWRGASTTCAPNPCPQPTGACCAADATCSVETAAACSGAFQGVGTDCSMMTCPLVLTPFVDPLPRPAIATPVTGASGGAADYQLAMVQLTQQLHRDLPATTVWGFDDGTTGGTYPGPTIEARENEPVRVTWLNDLRDATGALRTEHILPVDDCPHGAETSDPRTVVHLHGGHVAAASDGYPEATFLPGEMAVYDYPNWQEAAQIWYHDHSLGITRLNVYMGLAGLYTLRDSVDDGLDLPSGEFELPLVIQDRSFAPDGSLMYPAAWQEHFFGDTNLVNGKVWPYLEVARGKYRFRVVNGANSRVYTLYLSDGTPMTIIGGDGGLLDAPADVDELTLGPGERADVVVDFEGHAAGTELFLQNRAPAPYPGRAGQGVLPDVMKLVVADRVGHMAPLPATLRALERLSEADAVTTRDFELQRGADDCGGRAWLINGLGWDDITETPALGTVEVWRFINRSGIAHPMHMHLVFFEVLDRQAFELVGDTVVPMGTPEPPRAHETGPKDTVMVDPNEIVRVITRFDDFVGRYAYHCHILEHEDHEMMRQFETTTTCGDGARGLPDEECDDGNLADGDGCSATCTLEAAADAGPTDSGVMSDAAPSVDAGPGPADDDGCGCRLPGRPSRGAPGWLLLVAAIVAARRRVVR
jgi:spore coat protein A